MTWDALLHQVLAGLATGGINESLALALVMIYQATHLVTIALAFILGVLIERIIIRPVENAPVLAVVVVFIALLVILNSVTGWIYTYTIKSFPSPFPKEMALGRFM